METLPLLALRDIVVFPKMIVPLFVGRKRSIRALERVLEQGKRIIVVSQKNGDEDNPEADALYDVGVVAHVMQLLKLPDNTVKVLIEGERRVSLVNVFEKNGAFECDFEHFDEPVADEEDSELRAFERAVKLQFGDYAKLNSKINSDVLSSVLKITDVQSLCDTIASHVQFDIAKKQSVLAEKDLKARLEKICCLLQGENDVLDTEKKIRERVKSQMEKAQKEYYLNEQLKAINKELNNGEEDRNEQQEYEEKIKKTSLSQDAKKQALNELRRLKNMAPMSAEATVTRNYLDWMLDVPWKKRLKVISDPALAQKVLDEDHYGLDKVKERVLEYLAVMQRTKKMKGPVLCLYGPPGVGKTSLASSIAKATGRKLVKIALGGVRDEAEIRGHRRTYVGAMPGKIIQAMKKAGSSNPLILLDEIDKMGRDFRGDPASALLEVLDPEQNCKFSDHFLEVEYDLSEVMFVCTANSLDMPLPLLDRLEIIRLSGYTEEEKCEIAQRHLLSKQCENHGLKEGELEITRGALLDLIRYYTKESGVRNLERELAKVARKTVRNLVTATATAPVVVSSDNVGQFCGVRKYDYDRASEQDLVGVVSGLAYTQVGGEILFIEAVTLDGAGKVKATGKLGDVMQESVQAAFSYLRSRSHEFGVKSESFKTLDLHVHVPEGATPKDGPSAGVAMFIAALSVMTGIPVRCDTAMTGEISLRGRVLAIGGLKEKLLAALRGGIKTVLIPKENEKDLAEMPANVTSGLNIRCISHVKEALEFVLAGPVIPIPAPLVTAAESQAPSIIPEIVPYSSWDADPDVH